MKRLTAILFVLFACNACVAQQQESAGQAAPAIGHYWFVMYKTGTTGDVDSARRTKVTGEHIAYIVGLRKSAKIIAGGAFADQAGLIGFQIYNCPIKEEVIKLTEADPLIISKLAIYEIHPWVTLKGVVAFE